MRRGWVLLHGLYHNIWPLHLRAFARNTNRQYLRLHSALNCQVSMKLATAVADNNHCIIFTQWMGIVDKFKRTHRPAAAYILPLSPRGNWCQSPKAECGQLLIASLLPALGRPSQPEVGAPLLAVHELSDTALYYSLPL